MGHCFSSLEFRSEWDKMPMFWEFHISKKSCPFGVVFTVLGFCITKTILTFAFRLPWTQLLIYINISKLYVSIFSPAFTVFLLPLSLFSLPCFCCCFIITFHLWLSEAKHSSLSSFHHSISTHPLLFWLWYAGTGSDKDFASFCFISLTHYGFCEDFFDWKLIFVCPSAQCHP